MKRHRILVVDDSRTMQQLIASVLGKEQDLEVVGFASDPLEAREEVKRLDPDVITLDVEMPHMNGLEFLEKLMRLRPTPVIMVSNHTTASADVAIQALEIGAVDCIAKPSPNDPTLFAGLADKVRAAATVHWRGEAVRARSTAAPKRLQDGYRPNGAVVAIGSSAGGIEALSAVLSAYAPNCPPTVITQHMPAMFTRSLAARLDRLCPATVEEASDGVPLRTGVVYIAPGGNMHMQIVGGERPLCRLREGPTVSGHRPSVDVMFQSVARSIGRNAVGVILSGMGADGAAGLLAMRKAGAKTIGQNEATCFIYGMPRTAFDLGGVERQLPLNDIGPAILSTTALHTG